VAGCCECGDESSGSCATELVIIDKHGKFLNVHLIKQHDKSDIQTYSF
jgi:hypothetical protein